MKYIFSLLMGILLLAGCQNSQQQQQDNSVDSSTDTLAADSVVLNPEPLDTMQSIRDNYNRIQAIPSWGKVDSVDFPGESTEGGIVYFYFMNNILEKMDINYYGEGGYTKVHYFFKDQQVSFVHEELYHYNAHMYMPEFDYSKTKKGEDFRFYYVDGKFIKGLPEQADPDWQKEMADRAQVMLTQKDKALKLKGL